MCGIDRGCRSGLLRPFRAWESGMVLLPGALPRAETLCAFGAQERKVLVDIIGACRKLGAPHRAGLLRPFRARESGKVLFPGALPRAGTLCAFGASAAPSLSVTTGQTRVQERTFGGLVTMRVPRFKSPTSHNVAFIMRPAKRNRAARFVLRAKGARSSCAPKAQNVTARGNAPGKREHNTNKP